MNRANAKRLVENGTVKKIMGRYVGEIVVTPNNMKNVLSMLDLHNDFEKERKSDVLIVYDKPEQPTVETVEEEENMKEKIKNEIYKDLKSGDVGRYDINTAEGYITIETYSSEDDGLCCEIVENNSVIFDGWIADSVEGVKLSDVEYILTKLVL